MWPEYLSKSTFFPASLPCSIYDNVEHESGEGGKGECLHGDGEEVVGVAACVAASPSPLLTAREKRGGGNA